MTKNEFLKSLAENAGVSQKDAGVFFNAFVETVTGALQNGEKISLTGFATIEVKDKAAKEGFNPLTKQKIQIAASKAPVFKFANGYKDTFNK